MSVLSFRLTEVMHLLKGLRMLRDASESDVQKTLIGETICSLMYQAVGKLKNLEPYMRSVQWIRDELIYENTPVEKNGTCSCGQPCRTKMCAACWKQIMSELHGAPGHVCKT